MLRASLVMSGALALAGCVMGPGPVAVPTPAPAVQPAAPQQDFQSAARMFVAVVERVEPVAEAFCREKRPDLNCDFRIVIDDRAGVPPNAFHTLDQQSGQPLIGFTLSLIADARNADELAFILGHEAGHHVAGHIPRSQNNAMAGALILGTIAALGGGNAGVVRSAQDLGASVGSRRYSRDYELEADVVGTLIALRAGFDPERGAAFFDRLPDPGNSFLGSHPPNAQRVATVQRTRAEVAAGRLR